MTREEATYYYRRYREDYEDAKQGRKRALEDIDEYTSRKETAQNLLSSSRGQKKNLEDRLADIEIIISLFENTVSLDIEVANQSAEAADNQYVTAIKDSSVMPASISSAYHTSGVTQDPNSAYAYQSCRDERVRLNNGIENLQSQIRELSSRISDFEAYIQSARRDYSMYDNDMKQYRDRASYYYGYL